MKHFDIPLIDNVLETAENMPSPFITTELIIRLVSSPNAQNCVIRLASLNKGNCRRIWPSSNGDEDMLCVFIFRSLPREGEVDFD